MAAGLKSNCPVTPRVGPLVGHHTYILDTFSVVFYADGFIRDGPTLYRVYGNYSTLLASLGFNLMLPIDYSMYMTLLMGLTLSMMIVNV